MRADHAVLVLELVDRVLQLRVEHGPVGDHDHPVVELAVVRVVQGRKLVREPGDRVGLAGAGRVLDEVRVARALLPGGATSWFTASHWWKRGKISFSLICLLARPRRSSPVPGGRSSPGCAASCPAAAPVPTGSGAVAAGLGGLPAAPSLPRLNGRNRVACPASSVVM